MTKLRTPAFFVTAVLAAHFFAGRLSGGTIGYVQQNLVSDLPGVAGHTDPNLVNPWGMAFSSTTPIWVSDNGSGLSTLYTGSGVPQSLVVSIPNPFGGQSAPTGVVFNSGADFKADRFIFATEGGTIAGWQSGTSAVTEAITPDAVYKGLALGTTGGALELFAANFAAGTVDVFNNAYTQIPVVGGFTDPNLPAGYAPFNIVNLGNLLYVTYAQQDSAKHDDVPGAGHGFVDVFSTNGALVGRLISRGALDSPWGIALAPASFGPLGGDLLIGNFGDGTINAFNPTSGAFLGTLSDTSGNPIVNQGLWGLAFGNGAQGTSMGTLYFTAGIPGPDDIEDHGLFGSLTNAPEPATTALIAAGLATILWRRMQSGYNRMHGRKTDESGSGGSGCVQRDWA
jgi:uncharacterized protein (TIGR03118 family)